MNYWLHRISHECEASYALKENGFLSIGWGNKDVTALAAARDWEEEDSYTVFDQIMETDSRSRWYLWYFAQIKPGDRIVVPEFGGLFSIYEAKDIAYEAKYYKEATEGIKLKWNADRQITWFGDEMYYAPSIREDNRIDIGFLVKVEPIVESVSRYDYADAALTSRMKYRGTTANINDVEESVEKAIAAAKDSTPLNFYESSVEAMADILCNKIQDELTPNKFERLVKWYLEKIGADSVTIPAKNEPGKEEYADADVIVEFERLKYVIYVQAKHHKAVSGDWAVEQVKRYVEQKGDNDEYNFASWVISSADFSDAAVFYAESNGVRLIDGKEFARMLIDAGIANINDAF